MNNSDIGLVEDLHGMRIIEEETNSRTNELRAYTDLPLRSRHWR
jgi:hypothetical protein